MSYASHSARYLENDVFSRSPEWLVTLVFESLLKSLRRAAVQIEQGDIEGKAESLARSGEIVAELLASLDRDKGGAVAESLSSLYAYFALEIMNIGQTLDLDTLGRVVAMVEELHTAFVEAAERVAPRRRTADNRLAASAA